MSWETWTLPGQGPSTHSLTNSIERTTSTSAWRSVLRKAPGLCDTEAVADREFGGVSFETEASPAEPPVLKELASAVDTALPDDLLRFYATVNGGDCEYEVVLPDRAAPVSPAYWFSAEEAIEELKRLAHTYFSAELPRQFVPLAVTGSEDDLFLLDLAEGDHGRVLAWMTGRPPGWHRPTDDALLAVAEGLSLFLALLRPIDDVDE